MSGSGGSSSDWVEEGARGHGDKGATFSPLVIPTKEGSRRLSFLFLDSSPALPDHRDSS